MEGKMFLIVMDAHSKWVEIHALITSMSTATIEMLQRLFASLGLPKVLILDNATTFTSAEFADFLQRNGITHV